MRFIGEVISAQCETDKWGIVRLAGLNGDTQVWEIQVQPRYLPAYPLGKRVSVVVRPR